MQRVKGVCTDRRSRKEKSEEKTEKEQLWKEQIQKETGSRKGREATNQQSCHYVNLCKDGVTGYQLKDAGWWNRGQLVGG